MGLHLFETFAKQVTCFFAAFRLSLARGGSLGPMQVTQRQMKHPFLDKKMEAVILISLSGQRLVSRKFPVLCVAMCIHAL